MADLLCGRQKKTASPCGHSFVDKIDEKESLWIPLLVLLPSYTPSILPLINTAISGARAPKPHPISTISSR
jgi:hypothetical protein